MEAVLGMCCELNVFVERYHAQKTKLKLHLILRRQFTISRCTL